MPGEFQKLEMLPAIIIMMQQHVGIVADCEVLFWFHCSMQVTLVRGDFVALEQ